MEEGRVRDGQLEASRCVGPQRVLGIDREHLRDDRLENCSRCISESEKAMSKLGRVNESHQ